jgi:hypothetical protein
MFGREYRSATEARHGGTEGRFVRKTFPAAAVDLTVKVVRELGHPSLGMTTLGVHRRAPFGDFAF